MQHVLTPYATPIEPFAWWDGAFTDQELDWLQDKAIRAEQQAQVGGDPQGGILTAYAALKCLGLTRTKTTLGSLRSCQILCLR